MKRNLAIAFGILFSSVQLSAAEEAFSWMQWEENVPVALYNEGEQARLYVIHENANALQLTINSTTAANAPGRRRLGPEFILVPAKTETILQFTDTSGRTTTGSFGLQSVELFDAARMHAAELLANSGIAVASTEPSLQSSACAGYSQVASESALPESWRQTAALLAVSCQLNAGLPPDQGLTQNLKINDNNEFGLLPYHADWLTGEAAFRQDDNVTAVPFYQQAITSAETARAENPSLQQAIQIELALLRTDLGGSMMILAWREGDEKSQQRLLDSEELLNSALAYGKEADDPVVMAAAYDFLAALNFVRGDDAGVIDNLEKAKTQAERGGPSEQLLNLLGSIGDYHKKWGNWRLALQNYSQAVRVLEEDNLKSLGADTYHNLASLYFTLGDFARALTATETALSIWEAQGNENRANNLKYLLALIYEKQGDYVTARQLLSDLMTRHRSLENQWDPVRIMTQAALSRIELHLDNLIEATGLSDEILLHLESRNNTANLETSSIYINAAKLAALAGDTGRGEKLLLTALESRDTPSADRIDMMFALQELYQNNNQTSEAMWIASTNFELIESLQTQIESSRLGPYWSGRTQDIYMSHVEYLLEHQQENPEFVQIAFTTAERARATSLRQRRQELVLAQNSGNEDAQIAWQGILQLIQGSSGESDEAQLARTRKVSEERELFFATYGQELNLDELRTLSLAEAMERAPPNSVLLDFIVGTNRLWRFDIRHDKWEIVDLGPADELMAFTDAALLALSNPNGSQQHLALLSEKLLAGLEIGKETNQLLISPSGRLNSLPFAPLGRNGVPLIGETSIAIVPSLSEYFGGQSTFKTASGVDIAVLADPVFEGQFSRESELLDAVALRSWSGSLPRLPATAVEAENLKSLFSGKEQLILTGSAATVEQFFSPAVRNAKIIHIATHGYFNEAMPELVGFALSSRPENAGFVSMADIASVQFNANLVVISACSTGQGEEIPGEGNMSLARTFLAQGVGSVISTLWPVSDRATSLFMKYFYESLVHDNADYAHALKAAQMALKEIPQYRNPYYWAAFTLTTIQPDSAI